jgi:predicted permease
MELLRIVLCRLKAQLLGRKLDADLDDEVRAHLEFALEENVRRGMTEDEARTAAKRAFGGVTQVKEAYRTKRGVPIVERMWRDMRFGIRQLRRSPGFTVTAVLTLALGIGAVTSVFSVVDTVLLKPFAFRDPERLVVLREAEEGTESGTRVMPVNYRHFMHLMGETKTLEGAAIFHENGASISLGSDHPRILGAVTASPSFFSVLGVRPMLGRDFADSDADQGAASVVLLSYEGWQNFFQGDPGVIGRTIKNGGLPATVIGVLPPGFRFPDITVAPGLAKQSGLGARENVIFQAMRPSKFDLGAAGTSNFNYRVIARLKPGVKMAQAQAELEGLQNAYSQSAHLSVRLGARLTALSADVTSGISGALWLMFAAVGGVLLIACVNLANLQLVRAVTAERETAVRAALGASKSQLVMARLIESLIVSAAGGVAGVALSVAGVKIFVAIAPGNIPRLNEVHLNLPVLLFAMALSVAAAMVFGIFPALRAVSVQPQSALQRNSSRTVNTQEGGATRNLLVGTQVACTIVLLIVTSLVLRSFSHLLHQDRGFEASHLTLAMVDLFSPQYGDSSAKVEATKQAFVDRAVTALRELPGVQSVGTSSAMPMTGETWIDELNRPDHPVQEAQRPMVNVRFVSQGYLRTMQIPLLAGRDFSDGDRANPDVVLISEGTARAGFNGENPLGRKLDSILPNGQHPVTVIGVVADTRINGLKNSALMVYVPTWAFTPWTLSFLVRSSQNSDALIPEIRKAVWNIDPLVAIPELKSMNEQVDESVATDRFQTVVLASFGGAALLLALLGVYGVMAYSVSLRQQEFGVRIALGSGKAALIRLVLRQAANPILLGAAVGLVLSLVALRWVRSLLYETPVMDPVAIGGSVLVLLAAATLAAAVPAGRAASVDPMRALRLE